MPNYDFLNLSSIDFEDLSRDLLQKELPITLESFTIGRDTGIDLRYAGTSGKDLIVQCKRYKDFTLLKNNLRKEVEKVNKLRPRRYILTTSVGLTPNQKDTIKQLFDPYIHSTQDIYGKDDLNNLLGIFQEIEKQHFKLWLSSTNVLEKILHSRVFNQSNFEKEQIEETLKVYVSNESFGEAWKILKEKKYVIISGIPGIGKSTLARVLVCNLLAQNFEEFVFLADSINDGFENFREDKKQVFFFDDFLGSNFLKSQLSRNEEKSIVNFIKKVSKAKDKMLILTTREYILKQAKQQYDVFNDSSLDFAKCVVDISQYTRIVKAQIFYNHLYFSNIKKEHIDYILDSEVYKKIVNHPNYSPRIIQTITNFDYSGTRGEKEFEEKIVEFLNYPESLWKHVYESQISDLSKIVLVNLMSAGTPILLDDLRELVQNFVEAHPTKYKVACDEINFMRSISELENTFIVTQKDDADQIAIRYHNPSVQDFLVNYFSNLTNIIEDVLKCVLYFNQFFEVFSVVEEHFEKKAGITIKTKGKIILNNSQKNILIEKLLNSCTELRFTSLRTIQFRSNSLVQWEWERQKISDYYKLNKILEELPLDKYPEVKSFVSNKFGEIITPQNLVGQDFYCYQSLFSLFNEEHFFDIQEVFRNYLECVEKLEQVLVFESFGQEFLQEYKIFMSNEENFSDKICYLVNDIVEYGIDDNLEDSLELIEYVGEAFEMDFCLETRTLRQKIQEKKDEESKESQEGDWGNDDGFIDRKMYKIQNEDEIIKNMFETLREK